MHWEYTIFIHDTENILDLLVAEENVHWAEGAVQLLCIYGSTAIDVEQTKHLPKRWLGKISQKIWKLEYRSMYIPSICVAVKLFSVSCVFCMLKYYRSNFAPTGYTITISA